MNIHYVLMSVHRDICSCVGGGDRWYAVGHAAGRIGRACAATDVLRLGWLPHLQRGRGEEDGEPLRRIRRRQRVVLTPVYRTCT